MSRDSVAVCGMVVSEIDKLVGLVRGGGWTVTSLVWSNAPAIEEWNERARAYILMTGTGRMVPCEELIGVVRARPTHVPLIVIGDEPTRAAAPAIWLPTLPSAALLNAILGQIVGRFPRAKTPSLPWRRKSDIIIGNSDQVKQMLRALDQLAPAQTPVIVTGESGVGKELVARSLHYCGPRAKHPFIALNCAAIPEHLFEAELFGYQRGAFTGAVSAHAGAFEAADKGTLFLDEIGDMPLAMQAKLLRVLETSEVQRIGSTERKKVNVRLVSATNRNLEADVKVGRFREDLYYRVHVYPIHVAPLRERPDDIAPIVSHHLTAISDRENRPALRMTSEAFEKLLGYDWPGNVRELVNLLERAVLMARADEIDAEHLVLPSGREPRGSLVPYRDAKAQFERDYYSQLMRVASGNISLAAKLGQKTRKEIYDALQKLGLDVGAYREDAPD